MYTLHYAPGSCSMLINMLLEELAVPFEAVRVDFGRGEHRRPEFLAINAKGKVPAKTAEPQPSVDGADALPASGKL